MKTRWNQTGLRLSSKLLSSKTDSELDLDWLSQSKIDLKQKVNFEISKTPVKIEIW